MATRVYTPASVYFDRARVRLADGELIAASAHAREAVRRALAEKCRAAGLPAGRRSSSELLRQLDVPREQRLALGVLLRVFNRSVSCLCVKPGRVQRAIEQAEKLVAKL